MSKKLIIIGAGVSGLSTGCYARMNGLDAVIFEQHTGPGGCCTSWTRQGFTFDYCIHNLVGSSPSSDLRRVWDELGALDGTEIIDQEIFVRVEGPGGQVLKLYADLDRLEAHLKQISPGDRRLIERYVKAARSLRNTDVLAHGLGSFRKKLGLIRHVPTMIKWGRVTMEDYATRFRDPFLRRAFAHLQYDMSQNRVPVLANAIFLAGLSRGDLGYPRGGSLAFSKRIEGRYLGLGGEVHYDARVDKILVRGDRAVGVRLTDGTEHAADTVISAADGRSTIYDMLDKRYISGLIEDYYEAEDPWQPSGVNVFMGLDRDLTGEPRSIVYLLDAPLEINARAQPSLFLELYPPAMGLSPGGKSVLKVAALGSHGFWAELSQDRRRYLAEKERVFEAVAARLEPRFPGLTEQIEVHDVSTPLTAERMTGNYHGWQPWLPPPAHDTTILGRGVSKTLPGLARFHMVGHWAAGVVGLPLAAVMGRNLIKALCKKDRRRFVTSLP